MTENDHDDVLDQIAQQMTDLTQMVTRTPRGKRRNHLAVMVVLCEDFDQMSKRLQNHIAATKE